MFCRRQSINNIFLTTLFRILTLALTSSISKIIGHTKFKFGEMVNINYLLNSFFKFWYRELYLKVLTLSALPLFFCYFVCLKKQYSFRIFSPINHIRSYSDGNDEDMNGDSGFVMDFTTEQETNFEDEQPFESALNLCTGSPKGINVFF